MSDGRHLEFLFSDSMRMERTLESKMKIRNTRSRRAVLVLSLSVFGACGESSDPNGGVDLLSTGGYEENDAPADWREFPLMIMGVTATTLPEVAPYVDVATYTRWYVPYHDPGNAFQAPYAKSMIEAAHAHGIGLAVPIPHLAHPEVENPNRSDAQVAAYTGDGIRVPVLNAQGQRTAFHLYDPSGRIRIPVRKDDISVAYVDYLLDRVRDFLDHLRQFDLDRTIVAWMGIEEVRYWRWDREYALQRGFFLRARQGDDRPLISYLPGHYDPPVSIPLSLVQGSPVGVSHAPPATKSITFAPPMPIFVAWDEAYRPAPAYPSSLSIASDENSGPRAMTSQVMIGNYADYAFGAFAKTNRIVMLHQLRKFREGLENVGRIHVQLGGTPPAYDLYNVPMLFSNSMTAAQARHDFWIGFHEAHAVTIYSYAYAHQNGTPRPAWLAYREGLWLVKSGGLRAIFARGDKTVMPVSGGASIPAQNYDQLTTATPAHVVYGWVSAYSSVNATLWKKGGLGILVVTHSLEQPASFTVPLGVGVQSVEVLTGEAGPVTILDNVLADSFAGIDARVYGIAYAR